MIKSATGVVFTVSTLFSVLIFDKAIASEQTRQPLYKLYIQAEKALYSNQKLTYKKLRNQLNNYPLNIYLDFKKNINAMLELDGKTFLVELLHYQNSPLFYDIQKKYLFNAGKQKRWQDFLIVSQTAPKNTRLECYYYRAHFDGNEQQVAKANLGAKKMWLSGHSRPKECDDLFGIWEDQGHLTDELIWQRMLLSFNANQRNMLKVLSNKVSSQTKETKKLLEVYQNPRILNNYAISDSPSLAEKQVLELGVKRLAKYDLASALTLYAKLINANIFNETQAKSLNRYIIYRALIKQETELKTHIDAMLPIINSDPLTERRLRWALKENDMQALAENIKHLSEESLNKPRWKYWQARVNQLPEEAVYDQLSEQRNFYGFIAAYTLNKPINIAAKNYQLDNNLVPTLINNSVFLRVQEFIKIKNINAARREWRYLLNQVDNNKQIQYALIAKKNNWHDLGVQSTIQGKQWNHIAVRFPFAHGEEFGDASETYGVNIDEIMAIARRESAFHQYATSPVGAKGLMQLMPQTAKETAYKNKLKYKNSRNLYDPELNIKLGSAYYAELMEKFNDNRVLATAAYNAGPHRVKNWLDRTTEPLDVLAFIESIPFKETREYVKAVFSYRLIYEARRGKTNNPIFSEKEQNYIY